jgi:hypothetical protein
MTGSLQEKSGHIRCRRQVDLCITDPELHDKEGNTHTLSTLGN